MKRFARIVSCVSFALLVAASRGYGQTPAQPPADASRYYAAGEVGATFGHKSSGSFGAELGGRLTRTVGVFLEGGRMLNAGTQALDDRAARIATNANATSSATYKINYFDAGIRLAPQMYWPVDPYLVIGFGLAAVRAKTDFAVGGTTVPPESIGIRSGDDLNGTVKKPFFTLGGGATYTFARRCFADFSLRYGRVSANNVIENDKGINTLRAQVGAGIRF